MNVLTFRNIRDLSVNGDIKINDRVVTRDQMNEVSAYLQQEDLFLGTMTVREHLLFRVSRELCFTCILFRRNKLTSKVNDNEYLMHRTNILSFWKKFEVITS